MIDCLNVARYFIVKAYEDGIKDALNSPSSTRIKKGEVRDWLNSFLDSNSMQSTLTQTLSPY